jgi:hypothetical protein
VNFDGTSRACDFLRASAASFRAWVMRDILLFKVGDVVTRMGWCTRGMCPMINSNGAFFVVAFGQALKVYWARGDRSLQFVW